MFFILQKVFILFFVFLLPFLLQMLFPWQFRIYFGVHRPIVNVDYFIVFALLSFRRFKVALLLLLIFVFFDFMSVVGQAFSFVRLQDVWYFFSFISFAPSVYKWTIALILIAMLFCLVTTCFFGLRSNRYVSLFSLNISVIYFTFLALSTSDESRFYRADNTAEIASQTKFFIDTKFHGFANKANDKSQSLEKYEGDTALSMVYEYLDWSDRQGNILLIVNESWGRSKKPAIDDYIRSLINVDHKRKDFGFIGFSGPTVAAELRELCLLKPQSYYLQDDHEEFRNCFPNMFKEKGYKTLSLHGAVSSMYDRRYWYPRIGFEESIFFESKKWPRRCYSFPGACDIDMIKYAADFFNSNHKGFAYWLTLNTHATYDSRDLYYDKFDCSYHEVSDSEVCRNLKLQAQFFFIIGKYIEQGYFDGVDIVIVGDHEPRHTNSEIKNEYFISGQVPWLMINKN